MEHSGLDAYDSISSYGADNASVNYGVRHSVFVHLQKNNSNIKKGNCWAHVIHNTAGAAAGTLKFDVEAIVIRIYNHFSTSAQRVENLRKFFNFVDLEWALLLRHVPTRWLSLFGAILRLHKIWPAVKSYFLSLTEEETSKFIFKFVEYEHAELLLAFLSQMC